MGAFTFVEALQVRQGLEVVGVQALLVYLYVGLYVVSEDLDLQVHAFLGQGRLDQLQNFGMGHRGRGNHQFLGGGSQAGERQGSGQGSGQQGLLHGGPCFVSGPSVMAKSDAQPFHQRA
ncbi:hypothetical protein D3C78_716930 [compost metagenome]